MTSFTNGVELTDPRCLLGKHEKAAPVIGCRPFAFLHLGTICLEVRIRSAALIFLARHKTAILGATLLAGVVRQLRGTGCQPVHSRIVAVGLASSPLAAVVLVARPPVGEVTAHPPPGSPRSLGAARYAVVEKKKLPLIYHQKSGANGGAVRNFFANIFSCFLDLPERTHGRSSYPRPRPEQSPGRSCRG